MSQLTIAETLGDGALRQIARDVAAPGTSVPFGVYMWRSSDPGAQLARHVEQLVFLETFGNTAELLAKESPRWRWLPNTEGRRPWGC